MAVEIKVPALGESVTEATVSKWLVKAGDSVAIDQPLCELETDKVTVEVNATVAGSIVELAVAEGATVQVGGMLCHIEAGAAGAAAPKPAATPTAQPATPKPAPAPTPQPAPGAILGMDSAGVRACDRKEMGHGYCSSFRSTKVLTPESGGRRAPRRPPHPLRSSSSLEPF